MNALIEKLDWQPIKADGKPVAMVLPYAQYLELIGLKEPVTPHEVMMKVALDKKSFIQAWREYLKVSQQSLASKLDVSQAAVAQMERRGVKTHKTTRLKVAKALGINPVLLEDE